jgi:hypothetical protein
MGRWTSRNISFAYICIVSKRIINQTFNFQGDAMEGNESVIKVGVFSVSQLDASEKSHVAAVPDGRKMAVIKYSAASLISAAVVIMLAMVAAPAFAVDNYAWVSKGPSGTDARQLVCSSNQVGVVFAGTNGGVYKTTDYGNNWSYEAVTKRDLQRTPA